MMEREIYSRPHRRSSATHRLRLLLQLPLFLEGSPSSQSPPPQAAPAAAFSLGSQLVKQLPLLQRQRSHPHQHPVWLAQQRPRLGRPSKLLALASLRLEHQAPLPCLILAIRAVPPLPRRLTRALWAETWHLPMRF
jgi:hypothetical protein